jgi:peptide methionine sulfoxide reductase MsrA
VERKATFGAGCFWGVEAAFRRIDGVSHTRVGYAGGGVENPSSTTRSSASWPRPRATASGST